MSGNGISYTATMTASKFHRDNSFVRLLMGPLGCGKSVACCMEVISRAVRQAPGFDGVRRSRWAIVRNTYPELKTTTIKTWRAWYPEETCGRIKWDSPISQHIQFKDKQGYTIDLEIIFLALDSENDIKKLKSLELTGIYFNELQYIPKAIFLEGRTRVNRYPSKKDGGDITFTGVIADTNPPDSDHWIYKTFEEQKPEGYKIFKYEPALIKLNRDAKEGEMVARSLSGAAYINNDKNDYSVVQNDKNYWLKFVSGSTDEEVKVNQLGMYGIVLSGRPVHPTYNDQLHFANKALSYNPLIELGLAWDFGLTPACAVMQLSPRGQLQVIDELWSEDMDLRDFASNIVIPHLDRYYDGWRENYESVHDPAGSTGSQTDGKNCEDILNELEIKSRGAAPNNDPTARRDGLKYFLGRMSDGSPSFILSNRCKSIRKGLMGAFQYARIKVGGDERYHEKPLKNMYSHICEALEYGCMKYASTNKTPKPVEIKPYKIHMGDFMTL